MQRRGKVGIGVAAAVVVAGLIAWVSAASAGAHNVIITTDAAPFHCTTDQARVISDGTRKVASLDLDKSLDCNLHFRIYNDGILPVHIDHANFESLASTARSRGRTSSTAKHHDRAMTETERNQNCRESST
jgi:hypothetical protein